jgi:hypothetical protein
MNYTLSSLLGAALIASAFSFVSPRPDDARASATILPLETSAIKGRVDPADGAIEAVAISTTDSVKAAVTDGMFLLNVRHGTYKLIVVGKPPYKSVVKDNVEVADGNTTDIGTIRLQE